MLRLLIIIYLFCLPLMSSANDKFLTTGKKFNVMRKVKNNMNYALQRQVVLSENIAAQDIPKYKAKDLKNLGDDNITAIYKNRTPISLTSSKHIGIKNTSGNRNFRIVKDKQNPNTSIKDNNVDISEQLVKVTENMNDYNLSTTIYKKMAGLVKTSIGR